MTRSHLATVALVLLASAAGVARADDTADDHVARAKTAHAKGDFTHARDELLAAFQLDPHRTELLFALGQVELNLGHYKQAIDYYERFKATNPPAAQLELAEQAIDAARLELQRPAKPEVPTQPNTGTGAALQPPPPPKPPPHREWDVADTTLTTVGGAAVIGGAISIGVGVHLPSETNSTLHTYETRVNDAYLARDIGIACAAAGAVAIGGAFLRWRVHLVDTTISVETTHGGLALQVGRRL